MNKITLHSALLAACILVAAPLAHADSICSEQESREANGKYKRALDLEKAGKLEEAYATGNSQVAFCVDDIPKQRQFELRVALALGQQAEKKGDLSRAYDWYSRHMDDHGEHADRVMRNQVKAKSTDRGTFGRALDHFKRRNLDADVKSLLDLALRNANDALKKEETAYAKVNASHMNSAQALNEARKQLDEAKDWLYYLPEKQDLTRKRAEQRGDSALANDGREWLRTALSYYGFADNKKKEQAVRDKARRLADAHAKKNETRVAVEYYQIAGDDQRADELEKRSAAEHEKREEKRKEGFKKETEDLEKELDL
jgi:hypothetical protein